MLPLDLDGQELPQPQYLVRGQATLLLQIVLHPAELALQHLSQPSTHISRATAADPGGLGAGQRGLAVALVDFLGGLGFRMVGCLGRLAAATPQPAGGDALDELVAPAAQAGLGERVLPADGVVVDADELVDQRAEDARAVLARRAVEDQAGAVHIPLRDTLTPCSDVQQPPEDDAVGGGAVRRDVAVRVDKPRRVREPARLVVPVLVRVPLQLARQRHRPVVLALVHGHEHSLEPGSRRRFDRACVRVRQRIQILRRRAVGHCRRQPCNLRPGPQVVHPADLELRCHGFKPLRCQVGWVRAPEEDPAAERVDLVVGGRRRRGGGRCLASVAAQVAEVGHPVHVDEWWSW